MDYTDTYSDKYVGSSFQAFIAVGHNGEDMISEDILSEYVIMSQAINRATATYKGETVSYQDIASSVMVYLFQPMAASPLDCFQEGAFNYPPTHSYALGLWSPTPLPEGEVPSMSHNISAGFDIFLDNVQRDTPILNVVVTAYNFCPWLRAINLGPDGYMMNPASFGRCRRFALDPLTSPQTPGGNDQYIALSNYYYYVTFLTLDTMFSNETLNGMTNPLYDADYAALDAADPNFVIESKIRDSAPDRTQYQDGIPHEMKVQIMDQAMGFNDTHAWLDYGDIDEILASQKKE